MLHAFLQSALSLPVMCCLMCSMLELRYPMKKSISIMAVFMSIIAACNLFLTWQGYSHTDLLNLYSYVAVLPSFFCFFLLSKNRGAYFLFSYFTECIFACMSILLSSILSYILANGNQMIGLLFRIPLLAVIAWISWRFLREPLLFASKNRKTWVMYAMLPILLLTVQHLFRMRPLPDDMTGMIKLPYVSYVYPKELGYISIALVCVLLAYVFISNTFYITQQLYEERQENQTLQLQTAALAGQCTLYDTAQEKFRVLRHDLRHHIAMLSSLLGNGQTAEAKEYLSRLGQSFDATKVKKYCLNPVVNSVLSIFEELAAEKQITLNFSVGLPEKLPVSSLDLGVVISNALENAMHACEQVSPEKREISLVFRFFGDKLIFEVKNPYTGSVSFDQNGIPVSTIDGHGIGSRSIAAFAKKYHSTLDYKAQNGIFSLRLLVDDLD